MDYIVKHMGQHRGNARLWFETSALNGVGLSRGTRYDITTHPDGSLTIMRKADGRRVVSGKEKNGKTIPIIDINDSKVLGALATELIAGLSVTAAHQILGQGVDARPVRALFKRIAQNLKMWDQAAHRTQVAYSLGRATG